MVDFLSLSAVLLSQRELEKETIGVRRNKTQHQTDTLPHSTTTILVKNNDKEMWAPASSLTVLMHISACTISLTYTHNFTNTALVVAEVFRVRVLTRFCLWRRVRRTINCLCTKVTSPTTSSVSVCVSSPLWLSDSRSKWSTEEQTGLQRKDCCWEPSTAHKQRPPGSSQQDGNVLSSVLQWQVFANNRVLTLEA